MPFIVSWPGKVEPGISGALVSQVDLFASIAALIGQPMPAKAGVDSQNILPALLGKSEKGRDYVVQEALTQLAVRKGNWKYIPPGSITERGGIGIWDKTGVDEPGLLFHLSEDPGETRNLAEQYPEKLEEMMAIILEVAPEKAVGQKELDKKQLGF
jgi:arylsulfatase A-like enzyme